jgi:hypothetical protein
MGCIKNFLGRNGESIFLLVLTGEECIAADEAVSRLPLVLLSKKTLVLGGIRNKYRIILISRAKVFDLSSAERQRERREEHVGPPVVTGTGASRRSQSPTAVRWEL